MSASLTAKYLHLTSEMALENFLLHCAPLENRIRLLILLPAPLCHMLFQLLFFPKTHLAV